MSNSSSLLRLCTLLLLSAAVPVLALGQSASPQVLPRPHARITQAIDESQLTLLRGNTHPFARPEFDRGAAPRSMPLHRMLLVLNRAPDQEAALRRLLDGLQDNSSVNYHKWLTPEQFGQQFGPADSDIQIVTSWLQSHGFQVAQVSKGRSIIEFSGSVSQVREAFHTEIHKYVVSGEQHWANSRDPQIPTTLVPVVAGISTLHNFVKKPHVRVSDQVIQGRSVPGLRPNLTFNGSAHAVSPADFATIYNVPNRLRNPGGSSNGVFQVIDIVGRSNINPSDIQNFGDIFGFPLAFNRNNIFVNGPDPGNLGGAEEVEAVVDVSWSVAVAPEAPVELIVSETTETTDGLDLSEAFIIDTNRASVMNESFGLCESLTGSAQETNEANLAEQAAAQGITFVASTGDSGAAGCDDPNAETVATNSNGVQIPAALPFTVAVGGTMFTANDGTFWNAMNTEPLESAKSYIPENTWNESCATAGTCAPDVIAGGAGPNILAGGGGFSTFFLRPAFQSGVTGLSGTNREVPDVSLNAAVFHDGTAICVASRQASCVPNQSGTFNFLTVGGTSVASPAFAGVMALVDERAGQRQGEAGFVLYKLAAAEATNPGLSACNASTGSGPTSLTCVFNDVTSGNNAVPGETGFGSPTAQFQSGVAYDQATGLGSVNVTNLLNAWSSSRANGSVTTFSTNAPSFPASIPHGTSVTINIAVAGAQAGEGTPTGDVSLIGGIGIAGIPPGVMIASMSLTAGTVSTTTTALQGGEYTVRAHYEGDDTFLPSDSPDVPVNIGKEDSNVQLEVNLVDPHSGAISNNVSSVPFGSNYLIRINVTGVSGTCSGNMPGSSGCPSGTITLKDGSSPLDGGTFALNTSGYTEDQQETLTIGSHMLSATYSGDNSFNAPASATTDTIMVTQVVQATTTSTVAANPTTVARGGGVTLSATVHTQSFGTAPTGTVTFFNGTTQLGNPVNVVGGVDPNTGFVQATASLMTTLSNLPAPVGMSPKTPNQLRRTVWFVACFPLVWMLLRFFAPGRKRHAYTDAALTMALLLAGGIAACGGGGGGGPHTDSITAKYSGDTNYTASTSSAVTVTVQ